MEGPGPGRHAMTTLGSSGQSVHMGLGVSLVVLPVACGLPTGDWVCGLWAWTWVKCVCVCACGIIIRAALGAVGSRRGRGETGVWILFPFLDTGSCAVVIRQRQAAAMQDRCLQ